MLKLIAMETLPIKVSLQQFHLEHELWLNELSFYRDELKTLDKFLLKVASANTGIEVMKHVEHFQNQFIREKEVLDELSHEIREEKDLVFNRVKELSAEALEHEKFDDHAALRDKMDTYKKIYSELKSDFMKFLSKTL